VGRDPRIQAPGEVYHVIAKGNRGCRLYADDHEFRVFMRLLGLIATRHSWACLSFCLMTNHYHLVLRLLDRTLSDGMRELNGCFSRFTNKRNGLDGHLFRNRFWSEPIEDEARMLQTARYVVLNPVRAGLCLSPEEWPWSSYRACAGLEFAPRFLAVGEHLKHFGRTPAEARDGFRRFVQAGLP
jgi:putative transposase